MCVCGGGGGGGLNVISCWADILGTKWGRRQTMGWGRKEKSGGGGGGDKMGWGWGALFLFGVVVVDGGWGGGRRGCRERLKYKLTSTCAWPFQPVWPRFTAVFFFFLFKHLPPPPSPPTPSPSPGTILLYVHRSEVAYYGRGRGWVGRRGQKSEGSSVDTARKRPERPWTAARTMEVLRRCPLAISQRLVHCAVAVSTAVFGQSQRQCPLHCC